MYVMHINTIHNEYDVLRRKLMLMYLLSKIGEETSYKSEDMQIMPEYVSYAVDYLQENFAQHIVVSDIVGKSGVGRTTLMTAFKRYTGVTVHEYLTCCRQQEAAALMRCGCTEQYAAEQSGFGDACNMIRSFRKSFKMTPKQYIMTAAQYEGISWPIGL